MPIKTALIIICALLLNYVAVMRFLKFSQILAAPVNPVSSDFTNIENSKPVKLAAVIGISSTVILLLSVSLIRFLEAFILIPWRIDYLNIPLSLLLMFLLSHLITLYIAKTHPVFNPLLKRFLPLIVFNSAALFIFFIYPGNLSPIKTLFHSVSAGLGLTVILMSSMTLQQRLAWNEIPVHFSAPFNNTAIKETVTLLITSALLVIGLAGFLNIFFFDF